MRGGPTTLGLRVPALPPALAALEAVQLAGAAVEREPRRRPGRAARSTTCPSRSAREADLVLDGGELPGTPSTVVDLRALRDDARLADRAARGRCLRDAVRGRRSRHYDVASDRRPRVWQVGSARTGSSAEPRWLPTLEVTETETTAAAPSCVTLRGELDLASAYAFDRRLLDDRGAPARR